MFVVVEAETAATEAVPVVAAEPVLAMAAATAAVRAAAAVAVQPVLATEAVEPAAALAVVAVLEPEVVEGVLSRPVSPVVPAAVVSLLAVAVGSRRSVQLQPQILASRILGPSTTSAPPSQDTRTVRRVWGQVAPRTQPAEATAP
jgi:hypothetical protein